VSLFGVRKGFSVVEVRREAGPFPHIVLILAPLPARRCLAKNNSRCEIRLLPPQRVPLSAVQYDEAASLLAELLLDAAEAKRGGVDSGGVIGSASDGAIGSVTPLPQVGPEGREAA
jgi:hypothetical protein